MAGPLALVGSGEYLPVMAELEGALLDAAVAAGRPRRYVQLPTAASLEGDERLEWWVRLGVAQAERLGAEAVPVRVVDRATADDPALASLVDTAGLVYLSGGNPGHLARTLAGTAVWAAVLRAWDAGAALAGCSAGAMAMASWVPDVRNPVGGGSDGFGVIPSMRVLPHFDRWMGRMPDAVLRAMSRPREGVQLVGIDEETALVHGLDDPRNGGRAPAGRWQVRGRRSAWLLEGGGRVEIPSGDWATLAPPTTAPRS